MKVHAATTRRYRGWCLIYDILKAGVENGCKSLSRGFKGYSGRKKRSPEWELRFKVLKSIFWRHILLGMGHGKGIARVLVVFNR